MTLNVSAADNSGTVAFMRFSNNGTSWSKWESFGPSKEWTLTTGNGTKKVYARFKDQAGNISPVCSDTILLTAPAQ